MPCDLLRFANVPAERSFSSPSCGGASLNREPLEYLHTWVETGLTPAGERRSRLCAQEETWAPRVLKSSAESASHQSRRRRLHAFERGEPYVGFAWVLRAMIYTPDMSIRNTVCMLRGSTEETGYSDRAESIAPACELRENNNSLMIRVKHCEARL
jgi:hypothetical protein